MAGNMDKGLYAAPQGLDDLVGDHTMEIEIENPDAVHIGIDGIEIDIEPQEETADTFDANLAEYIDDGVLSEIADDLVGQFDDDVSSRRDWIDTYVDGLKLLGLRFEDRTEPWSGACGVFHPMLTEAVVRFQSESIMETFPAMGPVKTTIIGRDNNKKDEAASRVREDMNWRLTEEMPEYRPEHEKLLWNLPLAGSAFKKVYYDPALGRQAAMFIPAEDLVVPYGATNLENAERLTHVMRKTPNDMRKMQVNGLYRDVDLGDPVSELDDIEKRKAEEQGFKATDDERFRVLEMHVELDLQGFEDKDKNGEETGIALPYVVTIEKGTATVLAIRRNWYEDDPLKLKRQHFVHYTYVPGFGFYGYGLIHLIGGYARSATSLIRQLVDAGTLANLPGGLKTRGLRVKGDDTPIAPGEFRDVDVASGSIKDNVMTLPYKEPSQTLFALFQNIVQEGRNFISAGDLQVSDMGGNAPVGTTLAILERTLKVMSAVQARLHYSMKQEFKLLKDIIRDYMPPDYDYDPEGDVSRAAKQSDYDQVNVIPVSDPNAATLAQKVTQYQAVLQLAQQFPQLYDLPLLNRQMIEVLGIKNAAKLVPIEDDAEPIDPVQENMNFLTGDPNKAFIEQNHEAHIAVHTSFIQDPKIQAQLQQMGPQGQAIMAAVMAHVNEHTAFEYRKQIEMRLGVTLPTKDQNKNLPPEIADQIAIMSAQAAQQLLGQNQQAAAQQQAQQQAQDPIIQMQQQELQIKMQELQLKAQKQQEEFAAKQQHLQLEQARIQAQKEIAAMQVSANAAIAKEKTAKQHQTEHTRMGLDLAKTKAQMHHQRMQQNKPAGAPGKTKGD